MMIKESIQQGNITLVNIYAPHIGTHKSMKQILIYIKKDMDSITIRVGEFNTQFTSMDTHHPGRKLSRKHWP